MKTVFHVKKQTKEVSLCVLQQAGQKEDGLLSNVSPRTQLRFPILFQGYVPVPLLIFLRPVCVVVVLLQLLQEVTFISHRGLGGKQSTSTSSWLRVKVVIKTVECSFFFQVRYHFFIAHVTGTKQKQVVHTLTELYNLPSSLMAKNRPASVPWMTTTPRSTARSFKTASRRTIIKI